MGIASGTTLLAFTASLSLVDPGDQASEGIVLLRFKEETPHAAIIDGLHRLQSAARRLPGVQRVRWGLRDGSRGEPFTHAVLAAFDDSAAREACDGDPELVGSDCSGWPQIEQCFQVEFPVPGRPPPDEPGDALRLLLFELNAESAAAEREGVNEAMIALPRKISGLRAVRGGAGRSGGTAAGYSHAYVMSFVSRRAREDALDNPAYRSVASRLDSLARNVLVFDVDSLPPSERLSVTEGLEAHAVYQRDPDNTATIRFEGLSEIEGTIEARISLFPPRGSPTPWTAAGRAQNGRFHGALPRLPCGGEYTIEVRCRDARGGVTGPIVIEHVLVGDIWLLAGQSNMEGRGELLDLEEPDPLVHCFTLAHEWTLAVEPLHWEMDSRDPVRSGLYFRSEPTDSERAAVREWMRTQRRTGAGLGLPFAKSLVRRTGIPIGLIASAKGATSMADWDPSGKADRAGALYGSTYRQILRAGGRLKGVLWFQGESDAVPWKAEKFGITFERFIAALRTDLEVPDLPVYYAQIGNYLGDRPADFVRAWERVRESQRVLESGVQHTAMIPVIDLPLEDHVHLSTASLKRLGRRMARVALREFFDKTEFSLGPRIRRVSANRDGRTIVIQYQEVNGGLLPSSGIEGFSLHERGRGMPLSLIEEAFVDKRDRTRVVLELRRPVPAGAVLYYGKGLSPACNLVDEEDMAAPAFGPMEIER